MTDILFKRSTGGVYFSTPINEGAKRVRKLMADDYVTLPVSLSSPLDIRLGDYVDIEGEGRFCIIETQYPSVSEESNSYDYELKFEAQYRKWANKIFKYHPQSGASECSWKLTASINVHVEQVLIAINTLGTQSSSYLYNGVDAWAMDFDDTIDLDVAKFISYDNINILDAISAIAEAFECEWWITDNVLHFGKCEFGDTYIEISRELNAVNISRSDTNEKTANRIYPFGSTENLPPKYNKALIFDVTNIYGASDSDYPNQIAIYDAQRPLTHEWFDSSLWKADEDTREIIYGVEESGSTSFVENDKEGKMVNIALHMFPLNSASFGKNKIILKAFRPYVNASENLDGGGQFATFPTLTIRGLYSYTLKDDEDGKTYTEQNPLSVSKVTSSISNGYQLAMEDEEVIFEIPKKIVIDNIEREIDTISDIKIALDYRVKVYNKGVINWTIYASNDYFVWEAENVKYSVQDVRLDFLNGKLQDEPIKAILDPSFADKGYALVLSNVSSEIVEIGDNFVIANINEKFVPSSYYSYPPSNDDSSNEVINAIADGRLMLSKDKGNYIDAYRYINGEKVFIGEQGYDDAEEMPLEEAIEDVVIFEDVKPDHTFKITNSWYVMEEGKDGDGNPTTTYRFFFNDELFTADNQFNESYIIEGKELSIRFSSGKLNGMTFGVNYSNNYTLDRFPTEWVESFNNSLGDVDLFLPYIEIDESVKQSLFNLMQSLTNNDMSNNLTCWEITIDEESHLPSTFYMPEVGDEFTMSGLNVSIIDEQYLPLAEQELYDTAFDYVKKTNIDASSYDCTMMADVMAGYDEDNGIVEANRLVLELGQRVLLKENVFFKNGRQSRVIGYEYPLDYPYDNPKYTIGEKASYSRFGDIESKLESIELSIKGNSSSIITNGTQSSSGIGYIIGTNDNTTPALNQNVYSALKSIKEFVSRTKNEVIEYLWRFTKGINVGQFLSGASGANIDSEGNAEVESVTSRTSVKGETIQGGWIGTPDFAQGSLNGIGGAMYQLNGATYAEFDYLTARKGATFAELIIQEYRSIGGALVISQANGEISNIYKWSNGQGYDIYLKEWNDNNQFVTNDLVRCQYWDRTINQLTSYWVRVVIATNAEGVKCLNMFVADLNGAVPQVGDKLVQMGNTTDTSRQGCILLTTENSLPRMAILDDINSTTLSNANYKAIYGSLDGFTDPTTNKTLSGYGMWGENAYLHGEFILSNGKKVQDVSNSERNILLATNQGTTNWGFGSSISGDYTISESEEYNGYKGVKISRSKITDNSQWEVLRYALRTEYIKANEVYHISFDIRQSENEAYSPIKMNFAICTGGGANHLVEVMPNAIVIDKTNTWQHCDITFTPHTSGIVGGEQVIYIAVASDSLNQWTNVEIVNLKLEKSNVSSAWSKAPEDDVTFAEFKVTTEGLSSRVSTTEGKVTQIEQDANSISLKVDSIKEGLSATGINIQDKKIEVTANDFTIKNNNGNITASADESGNWSTNALKTLQDDNATPAITANYLGDKALKFYHSNGFVQMEIGWDANSNSLMRYYNNKGEMLWKIGSEQGFLSPSDQDNKPTEIFLWYIANNTFDFDTVSNIASSYVTAPSGEISKYYQGKSSNLFSGNEAMTEYLNGWYSPTLTATGGGEADGYAYSRSVWQLDRGKIIDSQTISWVYPNSNN